jgi:hypothetical protein
MYTTRQNQSLCCEASIDRKHGSSYPSCFAACKKNSSSSYIIRHTNAMQRVTLSNLFRVMDLCRIDKDGCSSI